MRWWSAAGWNLPLTPDHAPARRVALSPARPARTRLRASAACSSAASPPPRRELELDGPPRPQPPDRPTGGGRPPAPAALPLPDRPGRPHPQRTQARRRRRAHGDSTTGAPAQYVLPARSTPPASSTQSNSARPWPPARKGACWVRRHRPRPHRAHLSGAQGAGRCRRRPSGTRCAGPSTCWASPPAPARAPSPRAVRTCSWRASRRLLRQATDHGADSRRRRPAVADLAGAATLTPCQSTPSSGWRHPVPPAAAPAPPGSPPSSPGGIRFRRRRCPPPASAAGWPSSVRRRPPSDVGLRTSSFRGWRLRYPSRASIPVHVRFGPGDERRQGCVPDAGGGAGRTARRSWRWRRWRRCRWPRSTSPPP